MAKTATAPAQVIKEDAAVEIRPFHRFDLYGIEELFQEAYPDKHWDLPPYDPHYCWTQMLDLGRRGQVLVASRDHKVVGVMACHVQLWPWNPEERFLENLHFFVAKDYRKFGVADKLIEATKTAAAHAGMAFLLRQTFGTEPDVLERWARMHGFKVLGSNLLFEPMKG